MSLTIKYKGEYYSVKEAAKKFHIKYDTLIQRLHRGWSYEEAIEGQRNHIHKGKPITLYNITYDSMKEASKQLHLNIYQIKNILQGKQQKLYIIDHQAYKNKNDVRKSFNLSPKQFQASVHYINEFQIRVYDKRNNNEYYFIDLQDLLTYYDIENINEISDFGDVLYLC